MAGRIAAWRIFFEHSRIESAGPQGPRSRLSLVVPGRCFLLPLSLRPQTGFRKFDGEDAVSLRRGPSEYNDQQAETARRGGQGAVRDRAGKEEAHAQE